MVTKPNLMEVFMIVAKTVQNNSSI